MTTDTKIIEAVVDSFERAYYLAWRESTISFPQRTISYHVRQANRAALEAAIPHLHPQPAELAEQQGVELPPLPPVDGYDKRVHGHYSAEQMRDYARNAIRSAKQEQACSGLGIDKMAKELLERHTVAVPVAVEDGRCFMVREQDALDAIRAALAATVKQHVSEAQGDMFWLAVDGERMGYSVEELIDDMCDGEEVEIQTAAQLPNFWVRVKTGDGGSVDFDVIDQRDAAPGVE